VVFTLSNPAAAEVTFTLTDLATGSAATPADYTIPTGSTTIAAGATLHTVTMGLVDDLYYEGTEDVDLQISLPSINATIGGTNNHQVDITDDDLPRTVYFASATSTAAESVTPRNAVVEISGLNALDVTVVYNTADSTAENAGTPNDYTTSSGTLTISSGSTVGTVSVVINDDNYSEADEDYTIALTAPGNATLASPSVHTATIEDNDGLPDLDFASATGSTNENVTPANIVMALTNPSSTDITFNYTVADGTATGGSVDYTFANGVGVTFPAGEVLHTIQPVVDDDLLSEGDEDFTVTLTSVSANADLVGTTVHTHDILDNETAPVWNFSLAASNAPEATGTHNIVLQVDVAPSVDKTVTYTVADAGASESGTPDDYNFANGTATMSAGQLLTTISAVINNDTYDEDDEDFTVTLSAPEAPKCTR
jgi:GH24 family phage-related lysozyme (muramidase)